MSATIKAKVTRISEGWVTVAFTAPVSIPGVLDATDVEFEVSLSSDAHRQWRIGDEVELAGLAITAEEWSG